ncbi:hypothetical protein PIROE2DRAFT_16954 [Piromyces sp. E2]|nr:hypothetical protein PIROE2DRAFT_16954 [Piromyces sp. E2]|eukprot:OUM57904.1 hypothetical protein PIROE2DRAFT_16954 [Piromyces sp. E2]
MNIQLKLFANRCSVFAINKYVKIYISSLDTHNEFPSNDNKGFQDYNQSLMIVQEITGLECSVGVESNR